MPALATTTMGSATNILNAYERPFKNEKLAFPTSTTSRPSSWRFRFGCSGDPGAHCGAHVRLLRYCCVGLLGGRQYGENGCSLHGSWACRHLYGDLHSPSSGVDSSGVCPLVMRVTLFPINSLTTAAPINFTTSRSRRCAANPNTERGGMVSVPISCHTIT